LTGEASALAGTFEETKVSTISLHGLDQSDNLCKRFAHLASTYFERPDEARSPGATVPLENLFRILQMFRYNAFSDEKRSGILALQTPVDRQTITIDGESWHKKIEAALRDSLSYVFNDTSQEQAIEQIQSALRWLATNVDAPSPHVLNRTKCFMDRLSSDL
jgi:hypothetical protein